MSATMRSPGPAVGTRFGVPVTMSAILHMGLVVAVVLAGRNDTRALPPIYRVELVAAPRGPRAVGEVIETPAPPTETPAPTPRRAEAATKNAMPIKQTPPRRRPVTKATPTPAAKNTPTDAPGPKAGGGEEGGKGADVASVRLEGVEFPYPAYLQNIVREIALRFKPRGGPALSADIAFMIRKDGTVAGIRFVKRSGAYLFDAEAMGAVESAARVKAFGPLPEGFSDDVLPVIFSFTPQLIR
jgi:protein TonB